MAKYSDVVAGLIQSFRTEYAGEAFEDEFAIQVWGGKGGKVEDLSDHQILQFLFLDMHAKYYELAAKVGQATFEKLTLSRDQRRRLDRMRN